VTPGETGLGKKVNPGVLPTIHLLSCALILLLESNGLKGGPRASIGEQGDGRDFDEP